MSKYKRGTTFEAILEIDPQEWAAIYPWESIRAEAQQGQIEHEMTITVSPEARSVLFTLDTQPMSLGSWKFDALIIKNGRKIYLPPDQDYTFQIIEPVTE